MILRALAIAVGLGLLGATAHIAIAQSGGYGTPHSFIVLAVAAGVGVGALTIGAAWRERRHGLAFAILIALLCGEAWGLLATGERIIAGREQSQTLLRDKAVSHRAAVAAVKAAEAAKPAPADRSRLLAAQQRMQLADDAARSAATDRNCRDNCRLLLQAAVDAAFAEVTAARNEITETDVAQATDIKNRIQAATNALREIPMPTSDAPLADRLGLPSWTLDLVTAALGSIAANGLAACMLAFGVNKRRPADASGDERIPLIAHPAELASGLPPPPVQLSLPQPSAPQPSPQPQAPQASTRPAPIAPRPAMRRARPAPADATTAKAEAPKPPMALPMGDVMAFAAARLYPDPRGTIILTIAHGAYRQWCATAGYQPLDPGQFADEFAQIVKKLKLTAHMGQHGLIIRGASIPQARSDAA